MILFSTTSLFVLARANGMLVIPEINTNIKTRVGCREVMRCSGVSEQAPAWTKIPNNLGVGTVVVSL